MIDKAKNPESWKGLTGYINKDKVEKYLPPPSDDTLILYCGPGGMRKAVFNVLFTELKYNKDEMFYKF